ncbi:MAG: hypothetical protein ABSC13_01735 [Dehalococcoidia bacterium]
MAKRGPKTEEGKSAVRLNAIQHGGLSTVPVIPGLEREGDWEAHRAGVLSSLKPEDHLEATLADRVALLLWRLARIARYEREIVGLAQGRIPADLIAGEPSRQIWLDEETVTDPVAIRFHVTEARDYSDLLSNLLDADDEDELSVEEAINILASAAAEAQVPGQDADIIKNLSRDFASSGFVTVRTVRQGLNAIATSARREVEDVLDKLRFAAIATANEVTREAKSIERERQQLVQERLLPDEQDLGKVIRYEAHLHRQLLQTLHELEAIQARRQGLQTPLARVDVQGLPGE